jgi:hypothetical protein
MFENVGMNSLKFYVVCFTIISIVNLLRDIDWNTSDNSLEHKEMYDASTQTENNVINYSSNGDKISNSQKQHSKKFKKTINDSDYSFYDVDFF